jgi:hypothetical protein
VSPVAQALTPSDVARTIPSYPSLGKLTRLKEENIEVI